MQLTMHRTKNTHGDTSTNGKYRDGMEVGTYDDGNNKKWPTPRRKNLDDHHPPARTPNPSTIPMITYPRDRTRRSNPCCFSSRRIGGMKQKGIISYGISPNRQNPLAGTAHDAVFNVFRRVSSQFLYWGPSLVFGYYIMNWAVERYVMSSSPPAPPPPSPSTAPRDFDHEVAKEGLSLLSSSLSKVQYSNRGFFCRLGTSTSTRRPVVLSSVARRSKRWTLRYYLGVEPGRSSRDTELAILNRLTCIKSPSLSSSSGCSNRSRHRQGMCWFWISYDDWNTEFSFDHGQHHRSHVTLGLFRSYSFPHRPDGYLHWLPTFSFSTWVQPARFFRALEQSPQWLFIIPRQLYHSLGRSIMRRLMSWSSPDPPWLEKKTESVVVSCPMTYRYTREKRLKSVHAL